MLHTFEHSLIFDEDDSCNLCQTAIDNFANVLTLINCNIQVYVLFRNHGRNVNLLKHSRTQTILRASLCEFMKNKPKIISKPSHGHGFWDIRRMIYMYIRVKQLIPIHKCTKSAMFCVQLSFLTQCVIKKKKKKKWKSFSPFVTSIGYYKHSVRIKA